MTFGIDEEFLAFAGRDHLLPQLTAESVGNALLDSPHSSDVRVSLGWLATAVRRSLAITIPSASDGPARKSDSDIRKELEALAKTVHSTWAVVFDRSPEVDSRIWDYAFRHWEGVNALASSEDAAFQYNQFRAALDSMDWLASFLRHAALETQEPPKRWRQAELRRLRIMRGQVLAPVFEMAFGQAATANNWPSGKEREKTPFMDFYQRMVAVGFGEKGTPDISGVLKVACKLHRQEAVQLREGIIPEVEWGAKHLKTDGE